MGLAPKNALLAEYALEGLGYSQSQAALMLNPLIDTQGIISYYDYLKANPVQNDPLYSYAIQVYHWSPSVAADFLKQERGDYIYDAAYNNLVIPSLQAEISFLNWFIIGVIGAILITLLIVFIL